MPLFHKIFGTGYRNLRNAALFYGIASKYDSVNSAVNYEYLNSIAQILIYSGFIGLILYLNAIKDAFISSGKCGKILTISFILVCISSSVFNDSSWIQYILLIAAQKGNKRGKYEVW